MLFNEFETKVNALPALSREALKHIANSFQHGEPGFSDYDTNDLARDLGKPVSSVAGVMARLGDDDLAFAEEYDCNGETKWQMIYTNLHNFDSDADGSWAAMVDFLNKEVK